MGGASQIQLLAVSYLRINSETFRQILEITTGVPGFDAEPQSRG